MANPQTRAVRFDSYGGPDVLYVTDVERPEAGRRRGARRGSRGRHQPRRGRYPHPARCTSNSRPPFPPAKAATWPASSSKSADGVSDFAVGDEVLGFSFQRSSHATHTSVPVEQLIHKPTELSWEVAGSLYVVGATAYAAVRAVAPQSGETVAVSAAAGGVGSLVVQLLALQGVRVLGIASSGNAEWLRAHGVEPIEYGDGLADRLQQAAPDGVDAFIDLFGPDYVQLAVDLGVPLERINTIISFAKAAEVGAKTEGSAEASTPAVLQEISRSDRVRRGGFRRCCDLPAGSGRRRLRQNSSRRHTHGKIVLLPQPVS